MLGVITRVLERYQSARAVPDKHEPVDAEPVYGLAHVRRHRGEGKSPSAGAPERPWPRQSRATARCWGRRCSSWVNHCEALPADECKKTTGNKSPVPLSSTYSSTVRFIAPYLQSVLLLNIRSPFGWTHPFMVLWQTADGASCKPFERRTPRGRVIVTHAYRSTARRGTR
jgi:hypothetical protein